ncbi:MAG: AI-2E family transporter [Oscillospiraceae bacterium]|jgi:predicted PurR-regulated permease PerM|nr:AI-2E family transporter [Oscillospiraceae bacterium]
MNNNNEQTTPVKNFLQRRFIIPLAIVLVVIIYFLIDKAAAKSLASTLKSVSAPLVAGLVVAYILNPAMMLFEKWIISSRKKKPATPKFRRMAHTVATALAAIVALVIITCFVWLVAPQIIASIAGIAERFNSLPLYIENLRYWVGENFGFHSAIYDIVTAPLARLGGYLENIWAQIGPNILAFAAKAGSGALGVVSGIFNAVVGFVLGINFLLSKKMILSQINRLMFAVFPEKTCDAALGVLGKANSIFRKYITGLCLDSLTVGIICTIGCLLLGAPFPFLIGALVCVTNVIPVFGPFIGAVPSVLIILTDSPLKALWFLLFLVVLQQLDGNVLVPLIQGDATGVPPVWILVAVLTGGSLFGIVGVLLAVPVFAVIYMLSKEWVEYRLRKKGLELGDHDEEFSTTLAALDTKQSGKSKLEKLLDKIKGKKQK